MRLSDDRLHYLATMPDAALIKGWVLGLAARRGIAAAHLVSDVPEAVEVAQRGVFTVLINHRPTGVDVPLAAPHPALLTQLEHTDHVHLPLAAPHPDLLTQLEQTDHVHLPPGGSSVLRKAPRMRFTDGSWMMLPGVQMLQPHVETVELADDALTAYAATAPVTERRHSLNLPQLTIRMGSPVDGVIGVQVDHFPGVREGGELRAAHRARPRGGQGCRRRGWVRELDSRPVDGAGPARRAVAAGLPGRGPRADELGHTRARCAADTAGAVPA